MILTFEEVGAIFKGMDIELEQAPEYKMAFKSMREAHGFALNGGVMGAVKAYLGKDAEKVNGFEVADLNKKNITMLRTFAKTKKAPGQFIEVMTCEGGCVTGPGAYNDVVSGRKQLVKVLPSIKESYAGED